MKTIRLIGALALFVLLGAYAFTSTTAPKPEVQPVTRAPMPPMPERRIVVFMGPMRPAGVNLESETFASPVAVADPDGQIVLYYEDFHLEAAGNIEGVEIKRSNNGEWVAFYPADAALTLSVNNEELSLGVDDVVMFNLSGQEPAPSIVMTVWRDGLFEDSNMPVFFEESDYQPLQRIPNWIIDLLGTPSS